LTCLAVMVDTVSVAASKKPKLGGRIERARRALGITQKDLAERMGVSQSLVSRWERAEITPPGDVLAPLARALRVSVAYLLGSRRNGNGTSAGNGNGNGH